MPCVSNAVLHAIIARHRLNVDGPIIPLESAGVVHALWRLGTEFLLRVPKNEAMCVADHRCEAVAIPLALDAGVPYSVVEYIDGKNLTAFQPTDGRFQAKLRTGR
jgi:hypothetical protein